MARPLTPEEREALGAKAYDMSVRGCSQRAVAQELGVARDTAASLLEEQRERRRRERPDTRERLLDALDEGIRECWRRLEHIPPHSASPAAAGLVNSLNSLLRTRMEVLGFKAPTKSSVSGNFSHQHTHYDLSGLTDEELEQLHALSLKVYGASEN